MFWKKKRTDAIRLEYKTSCKRNAFRYDLPEKQSVELILDTESPQVINISATGAAIKNNHYKKNERYRARLLLPGNREPIDTILSVLYIDDKNICHCLFDKVSEKDSDRIHQYIFDRQMEDLRKGKN